MDGNLAMNSHFENMSEKDTHDAIDAVMTFNGNKRIADFMLWKHHSDKDFDKHEMENLKYHSSWERLMPVVNKIESFGWSVVIVKGMCHIFSDDVINNSKEFANKSNNDLVEKICLVWKTVFEFVEYYNVEILNVPPIEKPQCGVGEKNRN